MEFLGCSRDLAVRGLIIAVFLGLWSQQVSAQISVVPIPKTPAVGENVLLSVSGVAGTITYFSWHRGETTDKNQMLYYIPNAKPPEQTLPPYKDRVSGFPTGSMEILGVTTNDSGSYTVQIQADRQQVATVTITVYASESVNNGLPPGAIAGIVIGILVVVALIAALIYLFLLKGNKSNSSELSMKETNSNPRSDHNLRSSGRNPATTGEEVNYSEVNFKPDAPKPTQPRYKENPTEYAEIRRT